MKRRPRLVGVLWRWHRRLGLVAALFVLVLAVSGIVLNHAPELGLDRALVDSPLLRGAYGDFDAELPAFRLGDRWLSRAANGLVYLDAQEAAPCRGELVGVVQAQGLFYVACAEELLLLTPTGQLVESVTVATGLPVPLAAIGLADAVVAVQVDNSWRLADLERIDFSAPASAGSVIRQLAPGELPAEIRRDIPSQQDWLSWERLLLDLHSGRLFGRPGVWLVDVIGVLLCVLALSGFAMWWLHRRRGL